MIGIYGNDNEVRLPMAYRGLTINNDVYPVGIIAVSPQYDAVTEPNAQRDGMESYQPRRISTMLRIEGVIKAESTADMHDKVEALNAAFDPVLSAVDDGDGVGYREFTFSVPTADTANYPSGLKPMQYFARSQQIPVPRVSKFEGDAAQFTIILQAVDPRRYLQTTSSITSDAAPLNNSLASYESWPTLTITMTGGGSASATWRNDTEDKALVLDLSGLLIGQVVVVDMAEKQIYIDGVRDMTIYVSGDYWKVRPGMNTLGGSSRGGTTWNLTWRRAFV